MILKTARMIVVTMIGGTVLLIGIVMLITPGPAFVVIPVGLAILATEFAWARKILKNLKQKAASVSSYVTQSKGKAVEVPPSTPQGPVGP